LIIPNPKEVYGEILIEWDSTKEPSPRLLCGPKSQAFTRCTELGIGGYYHPDALPALHYLIPAASHLPATLSFGAVIQVINSSF